MLPQLGLHIYFYVSANTDWLLHNSYNRSLMTSTWLVIKAHVIKGCLWLPVLKLLCQRLYITSNEATFLNNWAGIFPYTSEYYFRIFGVVTIKENNNNIWYSIYTYIHIKEKNKYKK